MFEQPAAANPPPSVTELAELAAPEQSAPDAGFWTVARSPRMLGWLLLFLAAAAACGWLGMWQLDRADVRGQAARQAEQQRVEAAAPVSIEEVLLPQTTFDGVLVGRRVAATGVYETEGQLLVENRVLDGRTGWLVLTGLRVPSENAEDDAAVLPVVRGWVADPQDAAAGGALDVPTGTVTVTGYLQASENSGGPISELVAGTTDSISAAELVGMWGGPIWTGYLVLVESMPPQAPELELLGAPTRSGSGLNVQNLAYAAQWWIFAAFAIFFWTRMVRDEQSRRTRRDVFAEVDGADANRRATGDAGVEESPDGAGSR